MTAHEQAFTAGRVVENSAAGTQHGTFTQAVGKTQPRCKVVLVDTDTCVLIGVETGDHEFAGSQVEVRPLVGEFTGGGIELVSRTKVDGQAVRYFPVILDVEVPFPLDDPRNKQGEVLLDGVGSTQQHCGHGVTGRGGVIRIVGKGTTEVETTVAAIGLVLGEAAVAEVDTVFEGVLAPDIREAERRVVGVFETDDGE